MNKRTFLKKIRYRREHWESTIDTIINRGLERELCSKNWRIKDVIAHITWYDKNILEALKNKSIVGSEFWNMSIDDRNEMIFNETQNMTLNEVLKVSKNTFNSLILSIEDMSDEELNSDDFIQRKEKRITWDFIGAGNFWHYEDHEDALIERFNLDYGLLKEEQKR
ncbi:MAG: hypothetical protein ACFFAE_08990 [Candidatus Hodarchaeota archaeon]